MLLTLPSFVSFHVAAGTILPLAIVGVSLGVASSLSLRLHSLLFLLLSAGMFGHLLLCHYSFSARGVSGLAEVCYPLDPLLSGM